MGSPRTAMPCRRFASAVCLILFATAISGGQDSAAVTAYVKAEMQLQHIPGLSLLVVRNGKIVRSEGFGLANVELHVPVKPESIFQSGSVGKQFTATAVMMLVESGKISLDDAVSKYITNAPEGWANIKVRHLLTHTSGLGDYPSGLDFRRDYTEDELLTQLSKVP